MNFEEKIYPDRDALATGLAAILAERLRRIPTGKDTTSIAFPGGSTPGLMLRALVAAPVSWRDVNITLTDERWVPVSSDRSNHRLLIETLFTGAARTAGFVPLYVPGCDPAEGLTAINAALAELILPLDIAVLGMGTDMHTASLFPGAEGLSEALAPDAPPLIAINAPGAEEPRVTLSAPVLAAAERHILIQGPDKHEALRRATDIADPLVAPICAVLDGAIVHYAD